MDFFEQRSKVGPPRLLFKLGLFMMLVWPIFSFSQWDQGPGGHSTSLRSVDFHGASNGWIVGRQGTNQDAIILHTKNGGGDWNEQVSGAYNDLISVSFANDSVGWAVGLFGTILHTEDGGEDWSQHLGLNSAQHLLGVEFADPSNGWIVGDSGIYHTSNGGVSWNHQLGASFGRMWDVQFLDSSTGWVVGNSGHVFHTSDGGNNWTLQSTSINERLFSVHFIDSLEGWTVGESGIVLHTDDGGSTWNVRPTGINYDLHGVHFSDSSEGRVVGNGGLLYTADGGMTWVSRLNSGSQFRDIFFSGDCSGWTVGENGLLFSYHSRKDTIQPSVCKGYTVPSGDTTYYNSGVYRDTITSATKCDSLIRVELSVISVDSSVSKVSPYELWAGESEATYQWLDCESGYVPVPKATDRSFAPSYDGDFAVEVTKEGCVDTSECHGAKFLGLVENDLNGKVKVRPNPTKDMVRVEIPGRRSPLHVTVRELSGKKVFEERIQDPQEFPVTLGENPGVYLLELEGEDGKRAVIRVIKQ